MMNKMFQTENDTATLILRVLLGIVFFPHGMQKLVGWFGGYGFGGTMGFFTGRLGIPAVFAFLADIAEVLGSLGLITGFLTRVSALGIAVVMAVAAWMMHLKNGFFMNWYGKQAGEGYEYHLLAVSIAIALVIRDGGRWSMDRMIADRIG